MGVCTHGSFSGYRVNTEFRCSIRTASPFRTCTRREVCCGTFIYDDYPAGAAATGPTLPPLLRQERGQGGARVGFPERTP
ncbi:MAG: hypothetical protein ACLTMP_03730 [Eggerthella lenta]